MKSAILSRLPRVFLNAVLTAFSIAFLIWAAAAAPGQMPAAKQAPKDASTYDPRVTFAPLTLPEPVNSYRSSNGAPGPAYWQNEADYEMHAAIDTAKKVLTNDETITYTNNSPDLLTSLWIHLEQNIYRQDSRAHNLGAPVGGEQRRRANGAATRPESGGYVSFREGRLPGLGCANADSAGQPVEVAWGEDADSDEVPLHDSGCLGWPHFVGQGGAWRDLRHGAVVSADVCV
jgi:hypothetical protein